MDYEKARKIIGDVQNAGDIMAFLPELARSLEQLPTVIDELQADSDVRAGFHEFKQSIENRLAAVEEELKQQKEQLFLSDAEHNQLIKDVHATLAGINEYLRRHT